MINSNQEFKITLRYYIINEYQSFLSKIDYTLKASVAQAIQEQTAREVAWSIDIYIITMLNSKFYIQLET